MVNFIILNKLQNRYTQSHQIHFHLTNNQQQQPKHTSTHLKDHEAVIGKEEEEKKLGSPNHTHSLTHSHIYKI